MRCSRIYRDKHSQCGSYKLTSKYLFSCWFGQECGYLAKEEQKHSMLEQNLLESV